MKQEVRNRAPGTLTRRVGDSRASDPLAGRPQGRAGQNGRVGIVGWRRPTRSECRVTARALLPLSWLLLFAPVTLAQQNMRLACAPRRFQVVPGEPVRLELTVHADSAASIRLHVPSDPLLVLRAVEKLPVRRTSEGVIIHKRVILWQAVEPGSVKMDAISVQMRGRKRLAPEVTITVSDPGT